MGTRAFLALPVPEAAHPALVAAQAGLPFGRKLPVEQFHLTLAFLGAVTDPVLEAVHEGLAATRLSAVALRVTGLGTFAEIDRGLIFAEVAATPDLVALQARVARIVREAGADLPRRRFRPHITLARSGRQPDGPARDRVATALGRPLDVPEVTARRLTLFESHLGSGGAEHRALADYPLD